MSFRYIGNKTRLANHLVSLLSPELSPGATVADLMCGTASMAVAFRQAGYSVIAADLMTYSRHHANVRLNLTEAPTFAALSRSGYHGALAHLNELPPTNGFMVREYSPAGSPAAQCAPRQYFSAVNAARLDSILEQLRTWEDRALLTEMETSLLRHDTVLAVNRIANIAGTYGHYWSKWTRASQQPLALVPSRFYSGSTDHLVLQGRAEDIASGLTCDLCYLDPPYTKRQYAANYHILETVARGDEPEAIGVSGLRPWRDQYSDFCSKVRIRDAFRMIITQANCPLFAVSYSEDGLLTRDETASLLAEFGSVTSYAFPFPRFKSNQSNLTRTLSEFLFVLDTARPAGHHLEIELPSLLSPAMQLAVDE